MHIIQMTTIFRYCLTEKLMFAQLLKDIGQAKASVNVMYFIIKNDLVGRKLIEVRAFQAAGLEITMIKDITPIPHNGCRSPKRRRV